MCWTRRARGYRRARARNARLCSRVSCIWFVYTAQDSPPAHTQIALLAENHIVIDPTIWKRLEAYALGRARPAPARAPARRRTQRAAVFPSPCLGRARDRRHAHRVRGVCARGRRQVGQVGQTGQHRRAPQEALAVAEEVGVRSRRVGQVRAEDAARGVAHHEHEAPAAPAVFFCAGVQGGEGNAVLLEAVDDGPGVEELEAWGHEQPDFLCETAREEPACFAGGGFVAAEGEGREGWGLEGRDDAPRGLEDAVHVGGLGVEAAEEAVDGVGDGVGEVGGGRGVVLVLRAARHWRREFCRVDCGGVPLERWGRRGEGVAGWSGKVLCRLTGVCSGSRAVTLR